MTTRLVLYDGLVNSFVTFHAVRFVAATGEEVTTAAKAAAPKRSGSLAASIHMSAPQVRGLAALVQVGSDKDYAMAVHQGQRAHIEVADEGEVLFLGPVGFATVVHHPAVAGQPYLMEPLQRIGRRLGFIVTSTH